MLEPFYDPDVIKFLVRMPPWFAAAEDVTRACCARSSTSGFLSSATTGNGNHTPPT